ncbi:MAG: DUF6206 family protein [Marinovum sp.]|nr:DUF6206 family protein [Marinovum sp.]
MTDLNALRDQITRHLSDSNEPISKLGFFCAPFRGKGVLDDKVIKVYRGLSDNAQLDRLASAHTDYVDALTGRGVRLPQTEFHLLEMDGVRVPVVVQEGLPDETMMRRRMIDDPLEGTLKHMDAAGEVVATFWTQTDLDKTRIGFHPSIRNLAIVDGQGVFFDTFPPLIHYSRDEMGAMLATFSDKPMMRVFAPFLGNKLTAVQDEWYSAPETLIGLVGSACRLRPDDTAAYLDWGRAQASGAMSPWKDEILQGLETPPKLSGLWTGMRKVLGLQGEPNV